MSYVRKGGNWGKLSKTGKNLMTTIRSSQSFMLLTFLLVTFPPVIFLLVSYFRACDFLAFNFPACYFPASEFPACDCPACHFPDSEFPACEFSACLLLSCFWLSCLLLSCLLLLCFCLSSYGDWSSFWPTTETRYVDFTKRCIHQTLHSPAKCSTHHQVLHSSSRAPAPTVLTRRKLATNTPIAS